jgi:hypothetical protein
MNGDQERYDAAIRGLANGTVIPPGTAARIERGLGRAFAARHSAASNGTGRRADGRRRIWLAVAAAVIAAAAGIQLWRGARAVTEDPVMTSSPAPAVVLPPPPGPTATVPDPDPNVTARAAVRPNRPLARVVRPSGFVLLPGSAGLPQFESGTIVRMELPVASLPAYGIDISPAADDKPIQADVLVGQDGEPRAMRLINHSSRSVQ